MKKYLFLGAILVAVFARLQCNGSEGMEEKIIADIIAGNAEGVAEAVEYPISFFYPLGDITNKEQFVRAFPVIFDNDLRAEINAGKATEKWHDFGWRGRAFSNGMLWESDVNTNKIRSINYLSRRLHGKWLDALDMELKTLPEKYRKNVTKTLSFRSEDCKWWGRLDVQNGPPSPMATPYGEGHYDCRVMLYSGKPAAGSEPLSVFMCEDSAFYGGCNRFYKSKDGQFSLQIVSVGNDESPGCWIVIFGKELRGDVIRWPLTNEPEW